MNSRKLLCLATTGLIGACAPMEQAPLVYTSKVLVGAHVEAGTPENPGLAINLGIKGLDAAFVPVAVAKYCPAGGACDKDIYKLVSVQGTSDESIAPSMRDRLNAAQTEIAKLEADKSKADREVVDLGLLAEKNEREKARLPGLDDELKALNASALAAPDATLDAGAKRETLSGEIKRIAALEDPAQIRQRLATAETSIKQLIDSLDKARRRREALEIELQAARQDKKGDAFSVYGSFEGEADGDKDSAGLALGKVFSTGIAAQNLTQGIKSAAVAKSMAACLDAVDKAVEKARAAQKNAIAERLEAGKPECLAVARP